MWVQQASNPPTGFSPVADAVVAALGVGAGCIGGALRSAAHALVDVDVALGALKPAAQHH
jgi:hypothetical protein